MPDRDSNKSNLAFADVVVAGGMGLQSPENFQLVKNLAAVLGAEFGCLAASDPEGLGDVGPPDRPDRQDHPSETLHRRRHFRRDPASRRRRGRRHDRGDQHRQERADHAISPISAVVTDAIRFLPALTEAFRKRLSPHSRDRLAG